MARLALLDSTKTGGPARELEGKLRQLVVEQDEAIREIVEACDSTIAGIENGFNELGSFTWCPWTTEVLAELPPPADAVQHALHVSAADYTEESLAPGSIVVAFGPGIITNASIGLTDNTGRQWAATVLYSTTGPVNYLLPAGLPPGAVTASIVTGERRRFVDPPLYFHAYAPSLFSVTHDSLAAAG